MSNGIRIIHTNNKEKAEELTHEGWEPIECSFGNLGSVVGPLRMDHHGVLSELEGVAIRAYRDHFGVRGGNRAQFVCTGAADADATFAMAALAGLLPHPSLAEEFEKAPPFVKKAMTQDLTELAELINRVDIAPIGICISEASHGGLLLAWGAMSSGVEDRSAFHAGVDRWRALLGTRPPKAMIAAGLDEEKARVTKARSAIVKRVSDSVALVESEAWGFDVWYAEISPVIVALAPQGNVTIGVRDQATAEELFGDGGLKNVFSKIGEGWGGREAIGGSPRGQVMTWAEALKAAEVLSSLL